MTIKILLAVGLGIVFGLFLFPVSIADYIGTFISAGLCILLFFVGIDIGKQGNVINKIKEMGLKVLLVPLMVAVGSIVGSVIGGRLLGIPFNEAGAIGAGTSMDTTLPIVSNATDGNTAVVSFITGVSLSLLVPILVPLFMML